MFRAYKIDKQLVQTTLTSDKNEILLGMDQVGIAKLLSLTSPELIAFDAQLRQALSLTSSQQYTIVDIGRAVSQGVYEVPAYFDSDSRSIV